MSFRLKISAQWNIILQVKQLLLNDEDLAKFGKDFTEAVQIAAIELLENALKYSDPVPEHDKLKYAESIIFSLHVDDKNVEISVSNYCETNTHREQLEHRIIEIENNDPFQLYINRMQQIADGQDLGSQLGLYRIAFETGFRLKFDYQAPMVTVKGTRGI